MSYIVDRIEDEIAVLEDESRVMREVPLSELPREVQAGDVLSLTGNTYRIDHNATELKRKRMEERMKRLWK